MDPLQISYWIFIFLAGACIGSFLNVVIYRLPREENIVFPGSSCPQCKTPIRWYHNIPILGFFWLRGKCAACSQKISWRYPIVEFLTALLFCLVFYTSKNPWALPFGFFFVSALVASTFIDLDHYILPDVITLPGIVIGLLASLVLPEKSFLSSILGAAFGGGILLLIAWVYTAITKKDGIGGGDIKFLAFVGAFLGVQGALVTLVVSSVLGSILGIILIAFLGKGGKTAIPFGPFLALGALIAFLFGSELWLWYFHSHANLS